MVKCYLSILVILLSFDCLALKVSGTVTDRSGMPVANAKVLYIDINNQSIPFFAYTNSEGKYNIDDITSAETSTSYNTFLFCYPNPFNRQTVISFHLDTRQRIELSVYNMIGQKVRLISSGDFEQGRHQIVWDGLSYQGTPVTPGLYICRLQTKTNSSAIKMVVGGGENIASPVWTSAEEQSAPKELTEMSQLHHIFISDISGNHRFNEHYVHNIDMTGVSEKDFVIDLNVWTPFSTVGDYLGIYNGEDYTPFFVKGVNMGSAVPGSWPGQLAISSDQYARWFRMIAEAGFNTVRIYTLHYPRFYEEFARYNRENPDQPLYLLQGVWLVEEYPEWMGEIEDLYFHTERFEKEIKQVIDCIHGNNIIPYRPGEGWGTYETDISQWLIGFIIGREIHATEVCHTNYIRSVTKYSGAHVSIDDVSATEAWSVERIDKLISYERLKYKTTRPVAFSSWPTLDPLHHPSEEIGSEEDDESIDLNEMKLIDAPGGYFASYHAYPYYPNFINWDAAYRKEGVDHYRAYLRDLRSHYTNFPVLITEFGVPSSYGCARYSFSGMNHGGMTEEQQGNANLRMLQNIYDVGCGGGAMFSWMDEWFKRTWITNPLSSDNRSLWHDICSPENNFGLLRLAPNPQYYNKRTTINVTSSKTSKVDIWHDFTFLNLETTLRTPLSSGDTLWYAFDTYMSDVGESTLPNGKKIIRNRAEFLLRITPDSANLYVIKSYNLLGQGLVFRQLCGVTSFQTQTTDGEEWQLFQWQNGTYWEGREELPYMQDIGKLSVYFGNEALVSHQAVQIRNDGILIRIPWLMLNFSDPSSAKVVDDNVNVDLCCRRWACGMQYLNTSKTDGINVTMIYKNEVSELTTYKWEQWNKNIEEILNPNMYIEVEKESLSIIRDGLKNTPFIPKMK